MTLYEIDKALMEAFDKAIDPETGELLDEQAYEEFCKLEDGKDEAVENMGLWIKNLMAEAAAIKEEADKLTYRRRVLENKIETQKNYILRSLDGKKFETPRLSVSFRKSTQVVVKVPVSQLPSDLCRWKDPEPDKAAIKDKLKQGIEVAGCELVEKQSVQIK